MTSDQRFGGTIGEKYDLFPLAYPHYHEFQRTIADNIPYRPLDKFVALELGPGPGQTTTQVASRFQNARIIAVDNEPVMVKQAERNLESFGPRIKVIASDALEYLDRTEPESIDVLFSGYTLHNFDKKYRSKVLAGIHSALKVGGTFVNGDKYASTDLQERINAFNWSIRRYLDVYPKEGQADVCYDWIIHMGQDEHPDKIMVESEAIQEMKAIGFTNIKIAYRKKMEATLVATK